MDVKDFISQTYVQTAAVTVAGMGLSYAFSRWSGASDIVRYTDGIRRTAGNYATQTGLDAAALAAAPVDLSRVNSLFFADAGEAAVTLAGDGTPRRQAVRLSLSNPSGMLSLAHARGLLDQPEKIYDLFERPVPPDVMPKELRRESASPCRDWARPRGLKALWAVVARDKVYADRAATIHAPLDYMARVLVASPQAELDLSGPCHVALKVPGRDGAKPDVIVMPTTGEEGDLLHKIESGAYYLRGGKRTAHGVRDALVRLHAPRLKAFRTALGA